MYNGSEAHSVHSGQQHKERIEDHFSTQNVYPHFRQGSQGGRSQCYCSSLPLVVSPTLSLTIL